MKKVLSVILSVAMVLASSLVVCADEVAFTDVNPESWYYEDVMAAVELNIINGKTTTKFAPDDNLTYAEAIKLAACMCQIYKEGEVLLVPGGDPWYQTYVDYAKDHFIIDKDYPYNEKATRAGYMEIFANALPEDAFEEINDIPDDSIPDVPSEHPSAEYIYKLYRAGIVTGVDEVRNCNPGANIKRCEVATIISRMMNPELRKKFDMPEYEDIVHIVTDAEIEIPTQEAEYIVVNPTVDYDPGENQYYYDDTKSPVKIAKQPESGEAVGYTAPISLVVEAEDGSGLYTYQWKYRAGRETYNITDNESVVGSTTNKLTIYANSKETIMGLPIYCTITDANGTSVNSNVAYACGPFMMEVDESLFGADGEKIITGRLTDGFLKKGEKLSVERNGRIIAFITVADLQMFGKSLGEAKKGDNIGIVIELVDGVRPGAGDSVIRYQEYHEIDLTDIVN